MTKPIPRGLLYALFALSGFAGLIYESIWSHYLKLILGHAAYAQTLVLVIFMGGMAIGSWLTGRLSQTVGRPLLWYAGVELALGFSALLFDRLFGLVQAWLFEGAIADLQAGWTIDLIKWGAAAAITLPQAIMLGATFPLMSAGLLRIYPEMPGRTLSWLYFTNSLGAAIGVLASGFYLVNKVGLPGTIMTAGLVNCLLALVVYLMQRFTAPVAPLASRGQKSGAGASAAVRAMLLTAALTGAASFMYEIGWIRMLSLVLGSATHSFELMLSAFILGLALGPLYIRRHIDSSDNPLRLLGWIQVVMALLALLSLPLYMQTFDAMAAVIKALARTVEGYAGFTLFSHLVCLALMLPVTFCAGMTLPLITTALLREGHGEGSIGRVYAANTLGAIAGVLLAVHIVMPLLGLRLVVVIGALMDLGLGVWLLLRSRAVAQGTAQLALAGAVLLALGLSLFTQLDPRRTASGVFRHGSARATGEIVFHRDGKTATIDVRREQNGMLSIATNGKIDAGLRPNSVSQDDYTMVLASALPMAMLPEVRNAGVIGMGSGRSTHTLLLSPKLERVDTVEIEPAMVEGARQFGDLVALAYDDPRSHITIEDAKSYFARTRRQYDVIVSEPSNPWVSGVATLFSQEFYRHIKHYMTPDGLFVQWLQIYETDVPLMSTVFNALQAEFQDYRVYYADHANILIIASANRPVPQPKDWVLGEPGLGKLLQDLSVRSVADMEQRLIGSRKTLAPFFADYGWPANSDFFPVLDQNAAERRFLKHRASELADLYPYSHRLEGRIPAPMPTAEIRELAYSVNLRQAGLIARYYAQEGRRRPLPEMSGEVVRMVDLLRLEGADCDPARLALSWLPSLKTMVRSYGPYLDRQTGERIVADAGGAACQQAMAPEMRDWLELLRLQTAQDWSGTARLAQRMLATAGLRSPDGDVLLAEGVLAALKAGEPEVAAELKKRFEETPIEGGALVYLLSNIR